MTRGTRARRQQLAAVFQQPAAITELRAHAVDVFWAPPPQRGPAADDLHALIAELTTPPPGGESGGASPYLAQTVLDWGMRQVPDPIGAVVAAAGGAAAVLRTQLQAFMTDPGALGAAMSAADDLAAATGMDADALHTAALVQERRSRWARTLDAAPHLRLRPTLVDGVLTTRDGRFVASTLRNGAGWVVSEMLGQRREYLLDVDGCQLVVLRADL